MSGEERLAAGINVSRVHTDVMLGGPEVEVLGVTADGDEVRLSGGEVGLRRAEFEGQLDRLTEQPELLGLLAESYAAGHPDAEPLVAVRVVQRRHALDDGRRTGEVTESVLVDHTVPAAGQEGTP